MLALVEPCSLDIVADLPHLGCAMLIAACKEQGIETTLVKGQTRYLRNMFLDDGEELWNLLFDLSGEQVEELGLSAFRASLHKKGLKEFQNELKNLYKDWILAKNPRRYFEAHRLKKIIDIKTAFLSMVQFYLRERSRCDLNIVKRYVDAILKSNPRYIGFSLENHFDLFSRVVRKRVKDATGVPIIVGGALTPFVDEKILERIWEDEAIDYFVVGQAEHSLPQLLGALEDKKEPEGIANVFYRKDGVLRKNPAGFDIRNLDRLPFPDFSQFDLPLYPVPKTVLPLQTSRGCNWRKCGFCAHHNLYHKKYGTFGIERVVETIRHLKDAYACRHFAFHDEQLPPTRARRIAEALMRESLDGISIYSYARLTDGYASDALLGSIRKAGFTAIAWGMESGSQRILDRMEKGTTVETMSRVLKKSAQHGIANLCFLLFGFPGETREDAERTIEFLRAHAEWIDDILVSIFSLTAQSPIAEDPEKWGVVIGDDGRVETASGMSPKDVEAFSSRFMTEFGLNKIRVTSDRFKFVLPAHNRRMQHFLNAGHLPINAGKVLDGLAQRSGLNRVYPILVGEVKEREGTFWFHPVNVRETLFVNIVHPERERILAPFEHEAIRASDGKSSIEEITSRVCEGYPPGDRERVASRCLDFFREAFRKNWGLAYAKSWAD